jgi:hypothetical protein
VGSFGRVENESERVRLRPSSITTESGNSPQRCGPFEPLVQVLAALEPQLDEIDLKISKLAKHEAMIAFLMTVPGVGLMVVAMFVSVVDDATGVVERRERRDSRTRQQGLGLRIIPSVLARSGRPNLRQLSSPPPSGRR